MFISSNVEVIVTYGCYLVWQAVPIRDPAILSKIHQTYRIGYIKVGLMLYLSHSRSFNFTDFCQMRSSWSCTSFWLNATVFLSFAAFECSCFCTQDVILSRLLDDATLATINSIVLFNNVSVSFLAGRFFEQPFANVMYFLCANVLVHVHLYFMLLDRRC